MDDSRFAYEMRYDTPGWPKHFDGTPMTIEECTIALYGLFRRGLVTIKKDENGELYFAATGDGMAAVLIETAFWEMEHPEVDRDTDV